MSRYYTRVCNFYYGSKSRSLVKKRKSFPLNGNKEISFDEVEIISKVNEEVITNLDIDYEIKYLKFLNPKLDDLNNQNALIQLAKKSIIREIIKKKELVNYINLNEEHLDVIQQIEIDLINKKNLNNKNELKKIVLSKDLNYNKLFQKLKIEAMWNELIFQKYINNVKIDETKLKKQVQKFKNEYSFSYDYSLSEILFEIKIPIGCIS